MQILIINSYSPNSVYKTIEDSSLRCKLFLTNTVKEGIEVCAEEKPDLIIFTSKLSSSNDYELIKVIKSDAGSKHIPLLLVTPAASNPMQHSDAIDLGVDLLLIEPFSSVELLSQIRIIDRLRSVEAQLDSLASRKKELVSVQADELFKSRHEIKSIIEHAGEAIFLVNQQGEVQLANRRASDMLGYSVDEIEQLTISRLDVQYSDDKLQQEIFAKLQTGNSLTLDTFHIHKNGDHIPVEVRLGLIELESKNYVLGFVQDNSNREKAKEELNSSISREKELADVVRNAPMAIAYGYPDGRLKNCNKAFSKLVGYTLEELQLIDWNEHLTPPKWKKHEEEALSKLGEKSNEIKYEKEYIRKDGTVVPIELVVSAKFDKQGQLLHYTGFISDISKRKKAENALKRSEAKYRLLFMNMPDGVLVADTKSYYLDANERICKMLGFSLSELVGMHAKDIVVPNEVENIGPALDIIHAGNEYQREWCFKRKDGSVFYAEVNVSTLPNGNLLALVRDISERKAVESAIRESEEKFKSLMHESPFVVEIYNLDGLQIAVNRAYEELWGFPAETTVNKFNVFKSKEIEEGVGTGYIKRAYAGESVDLPEYPFDPSGVTEADGLGRVRWLSTRMYPLKDVLGKVTNVVVMHQDITERKLAEELLIKSETKFKSFVKQASIPLCHVERKDGHIKYVNDRFSEAFGYSHMDVQDIETLWKVTCPVDMLSKEVIANWQKAVDTAVSQQTDISPEVYTVLCKNKTLKQFLVSGIILETDLWVTFVDITVQKNAEADLNKHKEHLEDLVEKRTKELELKYAEMERMNKLFVGREFRIKELREKITMLQNEQRSDL